MRVVVVDDEQKVARALREGLQGEHYEVEVVGTGEDGFPGTRDSMAIDVEHEGLGAFGAWDGREDIRW